jgi:(+)-eremophilene synthase
MDGGGRTTAIKLWVSPSSELLPIVLPDPRNRDDGPLGRLAHFYDRSWRPHAAMERITRATDRWVEKYRLTETEKAKARYRLIDCGMCASYLYRHAREDIVQAASDLTAWLFIFDDYFGEAEQIGSLADLQDYCHSLEGVVEGRCTRGFPTPFHRSLADVCNRMAAAFGPRWRAAFWESFEVYFTGCLAEFDYRLEGVVPTYDEYRGYRKGSIGVFPIFELIDAPTSFLEPRVRRDPLFAELREHAAILCGQCNDMASYEKECHDGDPNNLVRVVRNHFGASEAATLDRCVAIHARDLEHFRGIVATVMSDPRYEEIRAYCKGLQDFVTGCYAFHRRSRRYKRESFHLIRLPPIEIEGVREAIDGIREGSGVE